MIIDLITALVLMTGDEALRMVLAPLVATALVVVPAAFAMRESVGTLRAEVAGLARRVDEVVHRLGVSDVTLVAIREQLARYGERIEMMRREE